MPPRRHRGTSVLVAMDPREHRCLMTGFYSHLVFDSDDHHQASWASVREELLRMAPPWPAALFRFELIPRFGPRLEEVRPLVLDDGKTIAAIWRESDDEYFQRHGIKPQNLIKGMYR